MANTPKIPQELQYVYRRMLQRTLRPLRNDPEYQKKILAYIKIGGEELAKQHLLVEKVRRKTEEPFIQPPALEEDAAED